MARGAVHSYPTVSDSLPFLEAVFWRQKILNPHHKDRSVCKNQSRKLHPPLEKPRAAAYYARAPPGKRINCENCSRLRPASATTNASG